MYTGYGRLRAGLADQRADARVGRIDGERTYGWKEGFDGAEQIFDVLLFGVNARGGGRLGTGAGAPAALAAARETARQARLQANRASRCATCA